MTYHSAGFDQGAVAAFGGGWRIYPLTLGSVATGTSGYSMAGVLPAMSRQLGISPVYAGQLVTIFALACAGIGPVVAGATRSWGRRRLAVAALVITSVGNVLTALAPTVALVVGARITTAVGVAVYVPTATALAAAIAAGDRRARAVATVVQGLTLALLAGVPVTSMLLGRVAGGYRGVFILIAGLCLLAAAAVAMIVPTGSSIPTSASAAGRLAVVRDRGVVALLGVTLLATCGTFAVYTYIANVVSPSTVHGWPVSVLLACYGMGAVVGNLLSGWTSDRCSPAWVLLISTVTSCVALLALTAAVAAPVALVGVLMVWGGSCWAIYTPINCLLVTRARTPVLLSLNASSVYGGMAAGGLLGGLVLAGPGVGFLPLIAAGAAAAASGLALVVHRDRGGSAAIPTTNASADTSG